jgi:hypothetical protein
MSKTSDYMARTAKVIPQKIRRIQYISRDHVLDRYKNYLFVAHYDLTTFLRKTAFMYTPSFPKLDKEN